MDTRTVIAAFTALFLLTACAPHAMMEHPQVKNEEAFISEMIPHHQEAVDTSRVMLDSSNEQVRSLATGIIAAQTSEITMMQGWKASWYPSSTYTATYENMMPDLLSLSGADRDRAFLEGMIEHHTHAIEMAKQAQESSLRPEVQALTENIISSQTDEIAQMREMLKE